MNDVQKISDALIYNQIDTVYHIIMHKLKLLRGLEEATHCKIVEKEDIAFTTSAETISRNVSVTE